MLAFFHDFSLIKNHGPSVKQLEPAQCVLILIKPNTHILLKRFPNVEYKDLTLQEKFSFSLGCRDTSSVFILCFRLLLFLLFSV